MSAPERIPPRRITPGPVSFAGSPAEALTHGELTVHGRISDASNGVLYCTVEWNGQRLPCVYKPVLGERPLWDFPPGTLARREVAAYEVSEATGWGLVPVTVLRDGPYGEGMCQLWIGPPPDAAEDGAGDDTEGDDALLGPAGKHRLLALTEGKEPEPGWKAIGFAQTEPGRTALLVHADDARLQRLAVLDAVINNADRKGRHLLHTVGGQLYAIDHGVSFHTDDKLRTLLWGWAGEPLSAEAVRTLRQLAGELSAGHSLAVRLSAYLTEAEVDAVRKRTTALLHTGRYPLPGGDWPSLPWPPI